MNVSIAISYSVCLWLVSYKHLVECIFCCSLDVSGYYNRRLLTGLQFEVCDAVVCEGPGQERTDGQTAVYAESVCPLHSLVCCVVFSFGVIPICRKWSSSLQSGKWTIPCCPNLPASSLAFTLASTGFTRVQYSLLVNSSCTTHTSPIKWHWS